MKFDRADELQEFIIKNKILDNIANFREICEGGSTYNFYVETKQQKYILKLIPNEKSDMYDRLLYILSEMHLLVPVKIDTFNNYKMLVMTYINGHKLKYQNVSNKLIDKLYEQYRKMQVCKIEEQYIRSQYMATEMVNDIQKQLDIDNSFIAGLINKYFFASFKEQIDEKPRIGKFIHGDFMANNILIDENNNPYLIDFDCLRFGYEIEDIAGLFVQLSGFRGLWGNINRFKKVYNIVNNKHFYSKDDWVYGIQMFYLHSLRRWVYNTSKKKKTLRKGFCFLISLYGYFRLISFIKNVK